MDKKDYRNEVYTFNYEGENISGRLQFDDNTNTYIISQPDSIGQPFRLFDFKRYPKITVNNIWNQRTFIIVLYLGLWLFFLLMFAITIAVEKKHDNKKVFED